MFSGTFGGGAGPWMKRWHLPVVRAAEYKVVRIEAKVSPGEGRLTCTGCGDPLNASEGRFALQYFRIGDQSVNCGHAEGVTGKQ